MRPTSKFLSVILLTLLYSLWVVCPVGAHLSKAVQTFAKNEVGGDCHGNQQPAPEQTCRQNASEYLPSAAAKLSVDDWCTQLVALGYEHPAVAFHATVSSRISYSFASDPPLIFLHSKLRI